MKEKGCGCKSMRNGGVCMRCGGKAKYNFGGLVKKMRDGGEIRKYGDGGEVEPPKVTPEKVALIKEIKGHYDRLGGPATVRAYGKKIDEAFGAEDPIGQSIHAILMKNEGNFNVDYSSSPSKGGGYEERKIVNKGTKEDTYVNKGMGTIYDYFSGNISDDGLVQSLSAGSGGSMDSGTNVGKTYLEQMPGVVTPTGTGAEKKPAQVTAPGTMKEDRTLPNWGRLKNEQVKLNQLIQNDTSADKPKLLDTDDVLGKLTGDAMDYYEKKGAYKRPELFSEANVEQYKKNASAGIGIGGVKTVQGEKTVQGKQEGKASQGVGSGANAAANEIMNDSNYSIEGTGLKPIRDNKSFKDIWGKPTEEKKPELKPISDGTIFDDVYAQHEANTKKKMAAKVGMTDAELNAMSPEAVDALKRTMETPEKPYFGYAGEGQNNKLNVPGQGTMLDDVMSQHEESMAKKVGITGKSYEEMSPEAKDALARTMNEKPKINFGYAGEEPVSKKESSQVKPKFGSIRDVMSGIGTMTGQGLDAIKGGFQQGLSMIEQLPKKPLPQSKEGILGEMREIRGVLDRMYSSESKMDDALVNKLIDRKAKLEEMYGGPIPEYNEPVSNNPLGDEVRSEAAKIKADVNNEFESFEKEFRKKMFKEGTDLNSLSPEVRSRYNQKLNEAYMKKADEELVKGMQSALKNYNKTKQPNATMEGYKSKVAQSGGVEVLRDMLKRVYPNASDHAINMTIKGYKEKGIQPYIAVEALKKQAKKQGIIK